MRQHIVAFLVALGVWILGNLVTATMAQVKGVALQPATVRAAPTAKVIITDQARCVQTNCWAWYLFTCNGQLPNCNGGCWVTGPYPCSACVEEPAQTCVQEQISVNAGLYRSDCTSNNGFNCNTCAGNYTYWGPYTVTTFRCR